MDGPLNCTFKLDSLALELLELKTFSFLLVFSPSMHTTLLHAHNTNVTVHQYSFLPTCHFSP